MLELRAGSALAVIDPEGGGRLQRLAVGAGEGGPATEVLASDGCFVMAPWAGRTGNGRFTFLGVEHHLPVLDRHAPHAIHGTVRDRPWTVLAHDATSAHLTIDLGRAWPWPGRCEHHVTLAPDHLELRLSVHADGPAFPAVIGWHPWFAKPTVVAVDAGAMLERGPDHLPTGHLVEPPAIGERALDDCFEVVRWPVVLELPELVVEVDAEGCRYVVVYDEQPHTTCVEPQTGPPNGLATDEHTIVTPEAPLRASTTWRWRTVAP